VAGKERIIDPAQIDFDHIVADIEGIRRHIPQRYEMEMLTAVVIDDPKENLSVGYKDLSSDDFWTRGHMPGMPLMPGVLMCEAAAQLSSYHVQKNNLLETDMVGFGGMEEIRFRDPVLPGDRLVIALKLIKHRPRRMCVCYFQGFVNESLVVEGKIKGIPLPVEALKKYLAERGHAATEPQSE